MLSFRHILPCVVVVTLLWSDTDCRADVIVELSNGRRLRASSLEIDPRDAGRLSLTASGDSIQIRRSVDWSRVTQIEADRAELIGLTIPDHVATKVREKRTVPVLEVTVRSPASDVEQSQAVKRFLGERPRLRSRLEIEPIDTRIDGAVPEFTFGEVIPPACCPELVWPSPGIVIGVRDLSPFVITSSAWSAPEASELVVTARSFNRSGRADWDSLELFVQGRTSTGQPCPVRGLLRCSLWGRRQAVVGTFGGGGIEEPRELLLLGQWSPFIEAYEADESGVQRVVLPLGSALPDNDLTLADHGLLTVEIDIPGQGTLATSTEPIPLRQVGPLRGRSILEFGSPFLPGQSTSRGMRAIGTWPQSASGLRPDRRLFSVQP